MEGPDEEEWMIKEFHPTETSQVKLRSIWNIGLNLGKKIALAGIVVSAAPLALPPLVVLSGLGVVFAVPFGFYLASYAVTDKLMSTLLSKPKPPPPPLSLGYEYVSGDDVDEEEANEYNAGKVEEEGYEEDYDLEVEEKESLVYDTCQVFDVSVELDEEESSEIRYDGLKDVEEVFVDMFEQDGYEEDAGEYLENDERMSNVAYEILEGIREVEEEMSSMMGEMGGEDLEAALVSAEIGWGNGIDVEQVEEVDVFGPRVSMEDGMPRVKFGDVELEELEGETTGMVASMRDEGRRETEAPAFTMEESFMFVSHESFRDIGVTKPSLKEIDDDLVRLWNVGGSLEGKFVDVEPTKSDEENVGVIESLSNEGKDESTYAQRSVEKLSLLPELSEGELSSANNLEQVKLPLEEEAVVCTDRKELVSKIASEILKGIREAEEEISATKDGRGAMLGNDVEAVVVSAEVGGENDMNVEQVEEVDVVGPRARTEDIRPKVKFGDVEPGELERETTGMIESIRDEGVSEAKNHVHSMEKTSPFASRESNECEDENADLQHLAQKTSPFLHLSGEEFSNKHTLEQLKLPSEEEVANAAVQEFSELVSTCQDTSKEDILAEGNNVMLSTPDELEPVRDIESVTDATREDKDLEKSGPKGDEHETIPVGVCARKLVVHVKKSGDSKATNIREETNLSTRGKTLIVMRPDTRGTATNSRLGVLGHPTQSTDHHPEGIDHNLPIEVPSLAGASTSKPIEGLNNEDSIWNQINAMRAIVGYEAPQHASCVEELKALYVFTGIEPPASFREPSCMVDVTEKLQFLMAVVGVKM